MIAGSWTELAVGERMADLRREDEHRRLIRSGRRGGKPRRLGWVRWRGWVGRIRAARIRREPRSPWRDPELLTRPGVQG